MGENPAEKDKKAKKDLTRTCEHARGEGREPCDEEQNSVPYLWGSLSLAYVFICPHVSPWGSTHISVCLTLKDRHTHIHIHTQNQTSSPWSFQTL